MSLSIRIAGVGVYVPKQAVSAADLDARLGVAPGTTLAQNGVAMRYFAHEDETASFMGAAAIERALLQSSLDVSCLDAILFSGVMSEQPMPSTAILIHQRLGARAQGTACFDINASCAGFLRGMEMAAAGIQSGIWKRVAVVSVELSSKGLRWSDFDTCTLFGDGAAAAVFEASNDASAILAIRSETLSQGADLCQMRAGGSRFNVRTPPPEFDDYLFAMKGRPLLRLVQQNFPRFLGELLTETPVQLVIPHQASAVGLAFLRKELAPHGLPAIEILPSFGNQVSASIPFALHHAIASGALKRGDTALLVGTAAGVTMNGIVFRY
ncbi:MAG: beta-ketoacyl-ACP synthase III [Acidobacteria bacterium]|nr:beta-ketoacyl-ACP synthase III [Acidobacteriota bacterium]